MTDQVDYLMLTMLYRDLPDHIQRKIMMDVLSRCGFTVSLKDLQPPTPTPSATTAVPIKFQSRYYCVFCERRLLEQESITEDDMVEAFTEHLHVCRIFDLIKGVIKLTMMEAQKA